MSTLTVRLSNDTHKRLKELARYRGVSINKLMEEFSTNSTMCLAKSRAAKPILLPTLQP